MRAGKLAISSLLAMGTAPAFAVVLAISNFDAGSEDWIAKNGSDDIFWFASGGAGDGGGFVQASDQSGDGLWFFSLPSKFLVQASKSYSGVLSFNLRVISASPPKVGSYADVQFVAADGSQLSYFGDFSPLGSWSAYAVPILPSSKWTFATPTLQEGAAAPVPAQMQYVLANLSGIRILGDYLQKGERTGLNSVVLAAPEVPEPSTTVMRLSGLAAFGAVCARRRLPASDAVG